MIKRKFRVGQEVFDKVHNAKCVVVNFTEQDKWVRTRIAQGEYRVYYPNGTPKFGKHPYSAIMHESELEEVKQK